MNLRARALFAALGLLLVAPDTPLALAVQRPESYSPTALAVSQDGRSIYVACATAACVLEVETATGRVLRSIDVLPQPLGLALSADDTTLVVTCAAPSSTICLVDTRTSAIRARIDAGYHAQAPVISRDQKTLYVAHRFDHEVAFVDLASRRVRQRVSVPREPVSLALTPDDRWLLVANHLQAGPADAAVVAASVTVVETTLGTAVDHLPLPNGSTLLHDLRVSPDGRFAAVAHQVSRFQLPTTQLERGWVNTSALTLLDLTARKPWNTVLLDNIDAGAANPWGVAWSADGTRLAVTHAGTHELSVIDVAALLEKLARLDLPDPARERDASLASRHPGDVPNDLSFLVGLRQRLRLPAPDRGPRAVIWSGSRAWVAGYFSDSLATIDVAATVPVFQRYVLGESRPPTQERLGESYFNDATLCFQSWQSCASCHSHDARVDSLNWDNLNDGIGNPKSGKSLLQSHLTPPSMWLGVRSNAQASVRAGIRNSFFTVQPPEVAEAIDAYLASLQPMPSPRLIQGRLSPAAERGRALFESDALGCATCHRGALFTDLKLHDVGTAGRYDAPDARFDTPSLVELWRTGPYLHDGRAASLRDVLTRFNPDDRHGATRHLAPAEIDALTEFLLSL